LLHIRERHEAGKLLGDLELRGVSNSEAVYVPVDVGVNVPVYTPSPVAASKVPESANVTLTGVPGVVTVHCSVAGSNDWLGLRSIVIVFKLVAEALALTSPNTSVSFKTAMPAGKLDVCACPRTDCTAAPVFVTVAE
jgi:hypothetical protein